MADVFGTDGPDSLFGTDGPDSIFGGAGNDTLFGQGGADELTGGAGNDAIFGGAGTDTAVFSGIRNDYAVTVLNTGEVEVRDTRTGSPDGTDQLGRNVERLRFADQMVTIAVEGVDLSGTSGPDTLTGGAGNDNIFGNDGNDTINGGGGHDSLSGGNGADALSGNVGNDYLLGGLGNDQLTGAAGNDTLNGDEGTDTAIFSGNFADYRITVLAGGDVEVRDNRTGSPDGTDFVWRNVEQLRFADGVVVPRRNDAASDFNGDGRSDIIWRQSDGTSTTWLGQSNGSFVSTPGLEANTLGGTWKMVGAGDFNGDGSDDILWRHSSGEIGQWLGHSSGPFTNNGGAAANPVDNPWSIVGVADYNGDGRDDILWRHISGEVGQWVGRADGGFNNNGGAAANVVDTSWSVVTSGDFNGDGRADALWRHSSGEYAEWRGTASGAMVNAGEVMDGATGSVVGSGDFNADGRDDVLTRATDGTIAVWLGQLNGQFSSFTPARQINDLNWKVSSIGDFNGDGTDDLLWRHSSGEGGEWLGSGSGDFAYNGALPTMAPAWEIQSPDILIV